MRKRNACLLSSFSFILGSTVTLFFVSISDDRLSNSASSSFSHFGHDISYDNITNDYFLLILIISSPDNISKRDTIRETWLQFVRDKSVKHFFVIGTEGLPYELQRQISNEYLRNGDIISLNTVTDSYKTLTRKVLSSFVFVEKEYDFKFLLKCDDDSFVHVSDLVRVLKFQFHEKKYLYWGFFDGRAHVKRTGKWRESNWFLCDRYLPYALGGGYVLSQYLVKYISRNAELLSLYMSEDISVGVWLSPLNISREHDLRFDTEYISRGCLNTYLITHKHSEQNIRHLYSETVTHGRMCTKEKLIRPSYVYNWTVPPSKCCMRNDLSVL